jgi:hypothetical protein
MHVSAGFRYTITVNNAHYVVGLDRTDATSGAGTADPSGASEFKHLLFLWNSCSIFPISV